MAKVKVYPSPATRDTPLRNSFALKKAKHNNKLYKRAKLGCLPGGAGHGGIDISGDIGDPALACIRGKISTRSFGSDYGKFQITIIAPDQDGNYTDDSEGFFYAHLDSRAVHSGQIVNPGDRIGDIGESGNTSGPHIHFEHRRQWKDWCTAINCHGELERARKLLRPITVTVGGTTLTSKVGCWLNDEQRPVIMARGFLERLRINGKKLAFEFQNTPPRILFSSPANATNLPLHFFDDDGMALLREVIDAIAPNAKINPKLADLKVEITGGDLTIVN